MELSSLIADQSYNDWSTYRNTLAHRSAPGRALYASMGGESLDPAADWLIGSSGPKLDANFTGPQLVWLVGWLTRLVGAAEAFTQSHF